MTTTETLPLFPNGEPATTEQTAPPPPDEDGNGEKLKHIFDLEHEVESCESDYLHKSESAKAAKKRLESAQDALNRFIRRLKEELPLFDRPPAPAEPEAWRDDSIRLLEGLSESIYTTCEEAGLFTIGQLCDWRKDHELIELAGIGAAKVTKIEDALETYWSARDLAAPAPAEEPEEVEI